MPQCEMCGASQGSLTTTKVEGAELELCDSCTDFGTEVREESTTTSTGKYSTSSTGGTSSDSGSNSSSDSSGSSGRRRDMFDQMDEIAGDYDDRIRDAREARGLSREELAGQLNVKASLIGKLERGDTLPEDDIRRTLADELEISLIEGTDVDEDWDGGDSGSMTLGDVVKRKD